MSELNSLRHAIGIFSTGFEISRADLKELIVFSATADYDEFKQACDNIKCKYPTLTEFQSLLSEIDDDDAAEDARYAAQCAADKDKIRMYSRESAPLVDGQRIARRATKAEVLAYFSHPSHMLAEFPRWKREISNQRQQREYGFTAEDLKQIDAEHLPIFSAPLAGRPPELDGGKRVNVYLDSVSLARAAELGNGNVSEGIRLALQSK